MNQAVERCFRIAQRCHGLLVHGIQRVDAWRGDFAAFDLTVGNRSQLRDRRALSAVSSERR